MVNKTCNELEKAYIGTYTGKKFYLLEPRLEDIVIEDIAHSLSQQCRWTGHTIFTYSVAQHSYYCSLIGPQNEAFDRLMHDTSESYLGDVSRPLKHFTDAGEAYRKCEKVVQEAIAHRFGFSVIEPPSVKLADNLLLYAERDQLMNLNFEEAEDWSSYGTEYVAPVIEQWTPKQAEANFLYQFEKLYKWRIN
jgi:hypothetical protein